MFSIIICSIEPEKFERISRNYAEIMGDEPFEIIGIHDAQSLSEGYNRGIKRSSGSIVVLCHDDIEILSRDFAAKIKRHLARVDIAGPAGTSLIIDGHWARAGAPHIHGQMGYQDPDQAQPYCVLIYDYARTALGGDTLTQGVQALDGVFIAMNRTVLERISFDPDTFDAFHGYDMDFTYSAFRAGFKLGVFHDIAIIHDSHGKFDRDWEKYNARFRAKHEGTLPSIASLSLPQMERKGALRLCRDREMLESTFELSTQRELARQLAEMRETESAQTPKPASYLALCLKGLGSVLFGRR